MVMDVTAAIIIENGCVLIARRAPEEKHAGGWEFPGGKVEYGESPEECLKREMYEEFGIETNVNHLLTESVCRYPAGTIRLLAYSTEIKAGDIKLRVHDKIEWVKVNELLDYELLPADIPIAVKLKEGQF